MNLAYAVYVEDNFHYQDPDYRSKHGEYPSWDRAVAACKAIVDESLAECKEPGMTGEVLYFAYTSFGESPFIVYDGDERFSAWDYARQRAVELCQAPEA
jgi:hypothetical protein